MSEFPQPSASAPEAPPPEHPAWESAPEPTVTIADDRDKALDPDSVTVARIVTIIWMTILGFPLVVVAGGVLLVGGLGLATWMLLAAGAAAYAALVAWSLYWPAVRYRHASYRVSERGLWIRRGVIWRSEISVLKSRVQHTDVSQGPLQRRFDLATLVLHTAGTQHAAVSLSGLSHETALEIRDYLIEGGPDDAV